MILCNLKNVEMNHVKNYISQSLISYRALGYNIGHLRSYFVGCCMGYLYFPMAIFRQESRYFIRSAGFFVSL
nr:MAG TPA: hypothetical protein [Caudoviricetes sp.]